MSEKPKRRPVCVECAHPFLVHIPEWFTAPCSRCDCRDYRPDPKAAS